MTDGSRRTLWIVVGAILLLAAVVGLATDAFAASTDTVEGTLALLALAGFGIAVWHLWRDDEPAPDEAAPSGADGTESQASTPDASDPVVSATPERAATDDTLSGQGLSWLLEEAGTVARDDRTVTAGIEWLRPTLRDVLLAVLVHERGDRAAAEAAIEDGDWTDDPVAASVLSASVAGPSLSLRERLYAWLFPERVLRERVRVTVDEIARVADGALPGVPGADAERTIPVVTPSVDDLQRSAEGRLDLAVVTDDEAASPPESPAADEEGDR